MMKPYDTVFSMAGHSVLPILALIHSNLSKRYVVMFSKELSENMESFEMYLDQKRWDIPQPNIECLAITSVGDFVQINKELKLIMNIDDKMPPQNTALFLQNGAKKLILAMLTHLPDAHRIFVHHPLIVQCFEKSKLIQEVSVDLQVADILKSRNVAFDSKEALILPEGDLIEHMDVTLDVQKRLNFNMRINSLNPQHILVMTHLSQIFGRNGAIYTITCGHTNRRDSKAAANHINIILERSK